VVRIKDVARVEFGAKSSDRYTRYNGAPGASIGIYQSPGANAVQVTQQVRQVMETLAKRFPQDLTYNVFFDTTVFVTSTIAEVIGTFAVMLAIGYSANTVSLLALVLAIGIVVDDAIVVIENVERVIEEEPDL